MTRAGEGKQMRNEFEVGDRVRVIQGGDYLEGKEGVITGYEADTSCWPWSIEADGGETGIYDAEDLELIDSSAYLVRDADHGTQVIFPTLEDAINDARGAAKECLGTFQVFKLVKSFTGVQEAVVVVEKDHN